MFGTLTSKLQGLFSNLMGKKKLTEENISEAVREVRLALLDADVNYSVASELVKRVKEKALGEKVLRSVTPGQQFMELVHEELVALMGTEEAPLDLNGKLSVVMLCGLQGSGKTTTCIKLASLIGRSERQKKILVAACDLQRPAAIQQLQKLGTDAGVAVFSLEGESDPLRVAKAAREKALQEGYDVLLVDTAGRLHQDEELMSQLKKLKEFLDPREVLFVASGAMGQDAVKTAGEFDRQIGITGSILTMLDSTARAGSAISIREVTKKPLKFEGVGEKISDLQPFNPRSMADRVLGMGDVINLVRKAKDAFAEENEAELEKKLRQASFTYDDFLRQMGKVKKMGSIQGLLKMLPGVGDLPGLEVSDQQFKRLEAMICSMTPAERAEKVELEHSRRKRIAKGSGVPLDEVNRMVKNFRQMKQFMKSFGDKKKLSMLQEIMKGKTWR